MKCPVCGEEVDMFDICDNCNYQNSGPKEKKQMLKNQIKCHLKKLEKLIERVKRLDK